MISLRQLPIPSPVVEILEKQQAVSIIEFNKKERADIYLQMYVPHDQQHPKLQHNHHQWQSLVMPTQV